MLLSFLPTIVKRLGVRVPGSAATTLVLLGSHAAMTATPVQAQDLPDHAAFTEVLASVVRQPDVDYEALRDRRAGLDAYLEELAAVRPASVAAASRDAQLAFWINAYNACMLRLVADHYPIQKAGGLFARVRNTVAGRPANSVWQIPDVFTDQHCEIAGEARSQDDIEHVIIRPMGEPRIHFAVNCAAKSCPPLWPEAYTGEGLERQLDRAVANLLGDERHLRFEDGAVRLNKVLDWFQDDFGGLDGLRIFLADHLSGEDAAFVLDEGTSIEFFDYDWTLNDIAR